MRFEVPQFIEVEAKIFGPLTWKQFIYVAGGVGVVAILYLTTSFFVVLLIGVPFAILAIGLAFHKINNRPLSIFLESVVNYFFKHKLYLWKKEEKQTIREEEKVTAESTSPQAIQSGGNSISSLARSLENRNVNK